jgi:molybdopterin/thiamine biosynthesis adenylyltransferase
MAVLKPTIKSKSGSDAKSKPPKKAKDSGKEVIVLRADRLNEDKWDRTKRVGFLDIEKIQEAKVLMVGCGAIGNEVAKNLILEGFRNISIIDMDYIVRSNLNRCLFFTDLDADTKRLKAEVIAEKMMQMDPDVKVEHYSKKIEDMPEDFIPSHQVVMGCLDNVGARLHLNAHSYYNNIPYIDAATQGLVGKVQVVVPPETSCLECGMNKTHMKILEKRFSCTGTDITFFEQKMAAEITTTAIVGAIQVREAAKIVSGHSDKTVRNMFYYDGKRNVADELEVDINPDCPHHILEE